VSDPDPPKKWYQDFLTNMAGVAAFVTVFAALIYALGLLALWMPITREFTNDLFTAWYAVTLLPRPVIAGQGLGTFVGAPLINVVLLLMWLGLTLIVYVTLQRILKGTGRQAVLRSTLSLVLFFVIGYVLQLLLDRFVPQNIEVRLFWVIDRKSLDTSDPDLLVLVNAYKILIVSGGILGAWIIIRKFSIEEGRWWPKVGGWKSVSLGVAVTFFMGLIATFPLAAAKHPPLPKTKVTFLGTTDENTASAPGTEENKLLEGTLLTHSEGVWYIFDSKNVLQAIPDSQMKIIKVPPEPD
jgi:hypothetical protein